MCTICKKLKHYSCNGLAETTYQKMSSENKGKWKCKSCKVTGPSTTTEANPSVISPLFPSDLKSEIMEEVKKSLAQFRSDIIKHFVCKTAEVKQEITEVTKAIDFLCSKYEEFMKEINDVKVVCQRQDKEIECLQQKVAYLEKKVEDGDRERRRENLMALGVPEQKNEDLNRIVQGIGSAIGMESLNIQEEVKEVLRLGFQKPGVKSSSRPILIKFFRHILCALIIFAKLLERTQVVQGSELTFFPLIFLILDGNLQNISQVILDGYFLWQRRLHMKKVTSMCGKGMGKYS